jgi:hypothetical protein
MKATPEYQIKYLNTLIWDIFEYYKMQDSIITVEFKQHELLEEIKFEYYFIDFPGSDVLDDIDEIENDLEERIRNSFKVEDAYVYLHEHENKIEVAIHDDMVLRFDYEAMKYMRDNKLDDLLD